MSPLLLGVAILLAVLTAVSLYRAALGPTVFDRVVAAGWLGTNSLILLVLIGFIYRRIDMFIDIAIAYALLNFVVTIALVKYFERGGARHRR
ncbi:MAG: pH regulation protein F [Chloroflexi bacterium]|nr:pH regulation protein F [Chloroflexota bacterium]